ncbi:MAG: hypothetical protein ACOCV2_09380 [Persicimonas sp.]
MSDSVLDRITSHLKARLPFVSDHGYELEYETGSLRRVGEYVFATFSVHGGLAVESLECNLGRLDQLEDEDRLLASLRLVEERFRPFDGEHFLSAYRLFEPGLFDLTSDVTLEGLQAAAERRNLRPSRQFGDGEVRPPTPPKSACYGPDGRTVIAVQFSWSAEGGWLGVYDVETDTWSELSPQRRFTDHFVACTPDGKVVLAGRDGLCLFEHQTGRETWLTDASFGKRAVYSVDTFLRGQTLVTYELRGTTERVPWVRITDLEDEVFQTAFEVRSRTGAKPRSAAVGPSGDCLYLVGQSGMKTWLDVWSLRREERLESMDIPPRLPGKPPINGYQRGRLAVSPDGAHVAVCAGAAWLLSSDSGEVVWQHRPETGYFDFAGFLPDGRVVASGRLGMEVLDPCTGKPLARHDSGKDALDMTVSAKSEHFTLITDAGLETYGVSDLDCIEREDHRAGTPRDLSVSRRADTFAAAYRDRARLWSVDDESPVWTRQLPDVTTLECAPKDDTVFALAERCVTRLDASSGEVISRSAADVDAIYPGHGTTYGLAVETVHRGESVRSRISVYDLEDDAELNSVECPLISGTPMLDDSGRIAVFEHLDEVGNRELQSWDLHLGEQRWSQPVSTGAATLSRAGDRLACFGVREIVIYDAQNGGRLGGREIDVSSREPIAFSPDGRYLAVTDVSRNVNRGNIALYELVSLEPNSVWLLFRRRLETDYFNGVEDICFGPRGEILLAAMHDGAVVMFGLPDLAQ